MRRFYTLSFCLILITLTAAFCQNTDYYFRHINTENGLSHNTVLTIMQDKTGFMWFGTKDGLNRYDGNTFKIFKHDENNPYSIGNNTIWSLLEMPDNHIWVGTDRGIYMLHTETNRFTKLNIQTDNNLSINREILDMKLDKEGYVWICSSSLFKYHPKTNEAVLVSKDIPQQTSDLARAWSTNIDRDNQIWISYLYGGIKKYNPVTNEFISFLHDSNGFPLESSLISKTINLNNDYLLIASFNDGLRIMNKKNNEITNYPIGDSNHSDLFVRELGFFSDGNYWIGTESGLYIHNPSTNQTTHLQHNLNDRFSLSDNVIYSMYEDREGGIWIGTYFGGINYIPLPYAHFEKFYPINNKNTISGERVSGICEDNDGNLWVGTEDAGINKINLKNNLFTHYEPGKNGLNYHNIHDIIIDGDNLWIATFSQGINVFNLKTNQWKYYEKGDKSSQLDNNDIFSLYKDQSNTIWVGTSTGAFIYEEQNDQFIKQNFLNRQFVSDIIEDSFGQIWFATYANGVYCYNLRTKGLKNYNYRADDESSICHYKITSIAMDSKKRLWFASESKGICMFDQETEKFIRYSTKDGFSNDVIYKILDDGYGNLWLSSNHGLMKFNPETKEIRVFTVNNGLPGNQFNYKSGFKDKSGKLYFGGLNGLVAFLPEEFIANEHKPPVAITDFQLLNDNGRIDYLTANAIRLSYNHSSFSINFSSLSYVAPEMNKYAYKMEGLDESWIHLKNPQRITYSNLKPGTYSFRVKASNNDGLWNEEGATLKLIIQPPFWLTTWAYLVYSVLCSMSVIFLVMYSKRKIEIKNQRKQSLFEREKEKEMYNSKIEFFTNVAHEIRTPLSLIKGPLEYILQSDIQKEELASNLEVMEKNTDRLIHLVNQLLNFRKTESQGFSLNFTHININELLSETYARFKPSADQKKLKFELITPGDFIMIDIDREAIIKVFSNLMNNAIKYADSFVNIVLQDNQENLSLSISNDGERIPNELDNQIFTPFFQMNSEKSGSGIGLALVKSLVNLHSGKVYLDTTIKDNNTFILILPKKQEKIDNLISEHTNTIETTEEITTHQLKDGPSILIVDDNEELLQFIAEKLSKQYNVYTAEDGIKAFRILEKEMINLIISDIIMPQMNGFELCTSIKENPEYSHIPIILLTAKTNIQSKITGLELGADAYIEKPFSLEYLHAQIANLLENREKLRESFNNSPLVFAGSIALTKADENFLNKLTDIILHNIDNSNFHVDKLAEDLFMSRSSLLRKIKGIAGLTPNDFIRLIRLKEAARILKEGHYKINEVCYLVGFSSTSYFSKAFQKQFGILPKDFVKSLKKE